MPESISKNTPFIYLAAHGVSSKNFIFSINKSHEGWFLAKKGQRLPTYEESNLPDGHTQTAGILFNIGESPDKYKQQYEIIRDWMQDFAIPDSSDNLIMPIHRISPAANILVNHPYSDIELYNKDYTNQVLEIGSSKSLINLKLLFNFNIMGENRKVIDGKGKIKSKSGNEFYFTKAEIPDEQFIYTTPIFTEHAKARDQSEFITLETFIKKLSEIHIYILKTTNPENGFVSYKVKNCVEQSAISDGTNEWLEDYEQNENTELIDVKLTDKLYIIAGICRDYYDKDDHPIKVESKLSEGHIKKIVTLIKNGDAYYEALDICKKLSVSSFGSDKIKLEILSNLLELKITNVTLTAAQIKKLNDKFEPLINNPGDFLETPDFEEAKAQFNKFFYKYNKITNNTNQALTSIEKDVMNNLITKLASTVNNLAKESFCKLASEMHGVTLKCQMLKILEKSSAEKTLKIMYAHTFTDSYSRSFISQINAIDEILKNDTVTEPEASSESLETHLNEGSINYITNPSSSSDQAVVSTSSDSYNTVDTSLMG